MKIFPLPRSPIALLFDLDSTLYTNEGYALFQTEVLVERLARERGEAVVETRRRLAKLRAELRAASGGDTSLGVLFAELGIPISTSVRWREELIHPGDWLEPDEKLRVSLERLRSRFRIALVTNNPHVVGIASLKSLDIVQTFELVIGLDDSMRSKPDSVPFTLAAERLGVGVGRCLSIGDRYDVDIAPALALGMGAILVDGVRDIYDLPDSLPGEP